MSAEIKSCSCKHEYQDSKYGKGQRVVNNTTTGYRCSVCNKETAINSVKKK